MSIPGLGQQLCHSLVTAAVAIAAASIITLVVTSILAHVSNSTTLLQNSTLASNIAFPAAFLSSGLAILILRVSMRVFKKDENENEGSRLDNIRMALIVTFALAALTVGIASTMSTLMSNANIIHYCKDVTFYAYMALGGTAATWLLIRAVERVEFEIEAKLARSHDLILLTPETAQDVHVEGKGTGDINKEWVDVTKKS